MQPPSHLPMSPPLSPPPTSPSVIKTTSTAQPVNSSAADLPAYRLRTVSSPTWTDATILRSLSQEKEKLQLMYNAKCRECEELLKSHESDADKAFVKIARPQE